MPRSPLRLFTCCCLLSLLPLLTHAQPEGWTRPFPGFRVIGNLYGVGTYDLGVFLITSAQGHILINTGLEDSTGMIRRNIESLGFRLEDIEILLQMQAPWDHVAALAEIKELSGAQMLATAGDVPMLEDGGLSDPHFGGEPTFEPVEVDRIIRDGDVIELGDVRLTVHEHPGHTAGSSSYSMAVSTVCTTNMSRGRTTTPTPSSTRRVFWPRWSVSSRSIESSWPKSSVEPYPPSA